MNIQEYKYFPKNYKQLRSLIYLELYKKALKPAGN